MLSPRCVFSTCQEICSGVPCTSERFRLRVVDCEGHLWPFMLATKENRFEEEEVLEYLALEFLST